jgi:hypothetical protein
MAELANRNTGEKALPSGVVCPQLSNFFWQLERQLPFAYNQARLLVEIPIPGR